MTSYNVYYYVTSDEPTKTYKARLEDVAKNHGFNFVTSNTFGEERCWMQTLAQGFPFDGAKKSELDAELRERGLLDEGKLVMRYTRKKASDDDEE